MLKNATKSGQGMTEYILLVVLIAIAVVFGARLFGDVLEDKFLGSTVEILEPEDSGNFGG